MIRSYENQTSLCHETDSREIVTKIREAVFSRVRPHIEGIDPNWVNCWIGFDDKEPTFSSEEFDGKVPQDYRLELSFKVVAGFNGPERGTVDLREAVEKLVPEPLLALLRTADAYTQGQWPIRFYNERHVVKIIPGRTIVDFENCEDGYVRSGDDTAFEVEVLGGMGGISPGTGSVYAYTLAQLLAELEIDEMQCQAVGVSYLPHGDIKTPEQLLASYEKQSELWRAEHEKRDAERAAAEAAEEAALTPEQRAEREAKDARLAAQAGIIREMMEVLPR